MLDFFPTPEPENSVLGERTNIVCAIASVRESNNKKSHTMTAAHAIDPGVSWRMSHFCEFVWVPPLWLLPWWSDVTPHNAAFNIWESCELCKWEESNCVICASSAQFPNTVLRDLSSIKLGNRTGRNLIYVGLVVDGIQATSVFQGHQHGHNWCW